MSTVPVFADRYGAKGIQNIDVKLGYWSGYLEKMDFLDSVGLLDLEPRDIGGVQVAPADVFLAGPGVADKAGGTLQDHGCVRLVAEGTIANRKVVYEGEVIARPMRNLGAMQLLTGIPAAVGIQMIGTGEITRKGLCTTADDVVDPVRYFEELGRRGYEVTTNRTETIVE
jgi:saccharopine dehydrogenase-like NADP-dependent oxidoreductase